jgi:hypothetical protein
MSQKTFGTPVSIAPVVPQEVMPPSDPRSDSRRAFVAELTEKGSYASSEISSAIQLLLKETKAEVCRKELGTQHMRQGHPLRCAFLSIVALYALVHSLT